jgi:lipocalin-like protein
MLPPLSYCVLFCLAILVWGQPTPAVSPSTAQGASISDRFIGAWRLVSVETIRPNGEVIYPYYGKHPEGLLIYDRNGWMSVQIISDPKPTVPRESSRESFLAAPANEKVLAIDGYYAYYGTWTVDSSSSTITHHIQQSLYPGERGETGERHFSFEGNRLTLSAKAHEMGEDHERRLVWERAVPSK